MSHLPFCLTQKSLYPPTPIGTCCRICRRVSPTSSCEPSPMLEWGRTGPAVMWTLQKVSFFLSGCLSVIYLSWKRVHLEWLTFLWGVKYKSTRLVSQTSLVFVLLKPFLCRPNLDRIPLIPVLHTLSRLPVRLRIDFWILTFVFRTLNDLIYQK